jgi:hypothetical protein
VRCLVLEVLRGLKPDHEKNGVLDDERTLRLQNVRRSMQGMPQNKGRPGRPFRLHVANGLSGFPVHAAQRHAVELLVRRLFFIEVLLQD